MLPSFIFVSLCIHRANAATATVNRSGGGGSGGSWTWSWASGGGGAAASTDRVRRWLCGWVCMFGGWVVGVKCVVPCCATEHGQTEHGADRTHRELLLDVFVALGLDLLDVARLLLAAVLGILDLAMLCQRLLLRGGTANQSRNTLSSLVGS